MLRRRENRLFGALLLLLVLLAGSASAQEPSALPFREQELTEALSARAPDLPISDLRVERSGNLFVVTLGPKARVIDLAGTTGMDAARVVALVALDLSVLEVPPALPPQLNPPQVTPLAPAT